MFSKCRMIMNRLVLESLRSGGSLECSLVEFGRFLRIFGIFEKNLLFATWDSLEHIGTVVPWEEGFSEVFLHFLPCIAIYASYDHNFITVRKSYNWTTL